MTEESVDRTDPDGERLEADLASSDPTVRRDALREFERLAAADPDAAVDHVDVDAVARRLDDDSLAVVRGGAEALEPLARDRPAAVLDHLGRVVALLDSEAADVALAATEVLSPVAVDCPDDVAAHVDSLLSFLDRSGDSPETADLPESVEHPETRMAIESVETKERERRRHVRETAANVVTAVAESDPAHLSDDETVGRLAGLLSDDNAVVVGAVVDALGLVAESNPEAVRPVRDALLERLAHDDASVRARTVRTLGLLGDDDAVPHLRDVADSDDDADVRELAGETAAFLAGS